MHPVHSNVPEVIACLRGRLILCLDVKMKCPNPSKSIQACFRPLLKPFGRVQKRDKASFRAVAILCVYNEERFIPHLLEHFRRQEMDFFVLNHGSTDKSVEQVKAFSGKGLIGIRDIPRTRGFNLEEQLKAKEALQDELDADWFLHSDADEFRQPPEGFATLRDWFYDLDCRGVSAADFQEFTFVPCRECPDFEQEDFLKTMKWYYPFKVSERRAVRAWKKQKNGVNLHDSGGHWVDFPGRVLVPEVGVMRHYLFLSPNHLREKYAQREFDEEETQKGWHGWRASLEVDTPVQLPSRSELNEWEPGTGFSLEKGRDEHFDFIGGPGRG